MTSKSSRANQRLCQNVLLRRLQVLLLAGANSSQPLALAAANSPNVYCLEKLLSLLVAIQGEYNNKLSISIQFADSIRGKSVAVDMSSDNFSFLLTQIANVTISKLHIFEVEQLPSVLTSLALLGFKVDVSVPNNNVTSTLRIISTTQKERILSVLTRILMHFKVDDMSTVLFALHKMNFHSLPSGSDCTISRVPLSHEHDFSKEYSSIPNGKTTDSLTYALHRYVKRNSGSFREQDMSMFLYILGQFGIDWLDAERTQAAIVDNSNNVTTAASVTVPTLSAAIQPETLPTKLLLTRWSKVMKFTPFDRLVMSLYGLRGSQGNSTVTVWSGLKSIINKIVVPVSATANSTTGCMELIESQLCRSLQVAAATHQTTEGQSGLTSFTFTSKLQSFFLLFCQLLEMDVDFYTDISPDTRHVIVDSLHYIVSNNPDIITSLQRSADEKVMLSFLSTIYLILSSKETTSVSSLTAKLKAMYRHEGADVERVRATIESTIVAQYLSLKADLYTSQTVGNRLEYSRRKLYDLNSIVMAVNN